MRNKSDWLEIVGCDRRPLRHGVRYYDLGYSPANPPSPSLRPPDGRAEEQGRVRDDRARDHPAPVNQKLQKPSRKHTGRAPVIGTFFALVGVNGLDGFRSLRSPTASLGLALLLLGCGGQKDPITDSLASWIAFVSDRDGNEEIYVMRPDGSQLRNLTNHEAGDSFPSWSPDGVRIAFQSARDGSEQIYVMNADGTDLKKLTDTPNKKNLTAWSPDGEQIAFSATEGTDVFVHVVSANGGDPKRLIDGMAPSWSPDGKILAFNRGQLPQIWLMDSDGGNARRLVSGDPSELSPQDQLAQLFTLLPVWSPTGDRILYTKVMTELGAAQPSVNYEVFTVSHEGSDRRRLTEDAAWDLGEDWSPDARKIVFTSQRDGNAEVYVMNADGTGQENLTRHDANDLHAAWSPFVGK